MDRFTFEGVRVVLPPTADVPGQFRPDGALAELVQEVLNSTKPWIPGDDPVETVRFSDERIFPMAIPRSRQPVVWGIHRGHRARNPQPSPFVEFYGPLSPSRLGYLTVELAGTPDAPILTRAYGGTYTPPLPWMVSAKDAVGGRAECRTYWHAHAYLDRRAKLIRPGTRTEVAPDWFVGL